MQRYNHHENIKSLVAKLKSGEMYPSVTPNNDSEFSGLAELSSIAIIKFDSEVELETAFPANLTSQEIHYALWYDGGKRYPNFAFEDTFYVCYWGDEPDIGLVEQISNAATSQPTLADSKNLPEEMGKTKNAVDKVAQAKDELSAAEGILAKYHSQLLSAIDARNLAKLKLERIDATSITDVIITSELVESYTVINNQLWIKYKAVEAIADEVDYVGHIGRILCKVNLVEHQDRANVEFYNLDRVERGYNGALTPHPHVIYDLNSSGVCVRACLGNYEMPLQDAIAAEEYELVADMLYNFITSTNTEEGDDAANFFPNWEEDVSFSRQNNQWTK